MIWVLVFLLILAHVNLYILMFHMTNKIKKLKEEIEYRKTNKKHVIFNEKGDYSIVESLN